MGLLNLLLTDPLAFILLAVPLLYSIIFHELAHGWVAYKMGDPTAQLMGRLSLNPLKHLDPIGTLMLFIVGFGWAKPVPVNYNTLKRNGKALLWVSSAGIVTNFVLAFIALFLFKLFSLSPQEIMGKIFWQIALINIVLASLNLIPIPPLDGSKILGEFLPEQLQQQLLKVESYGFFILIGLLAFGILDRIIMFIAVLLLSLINVLLGS